MLPAGSRGGASTRTSRSRTRVTVATALSDHEERTERTERTERRRDTRHGVRTVTARATAIACRDSPLEAGELLRRLLEALLVLLLQAERERRLEHFLEQRDDPLGAVQGEDFTTSDLD